MLYTIGYEGASIESFIDELKSAHIDIVLDVREFPLSRKIGFSKTALHGFVAMAGMEYQHWSVFGCPKPIRNRYKENSNWKEYCKAFDAYLRTQTEVVYELAELAQSNNIALVCYEADYNTCHRKMVADAAAHVAGSRVTHLHPSMTGVKTSQLSFA